MPSPLRLQAASGLIALSALLTAPGAARAADTSPTAPTAITNVYAGQSVIRFANPRAHGAMTLTVRVHGVADRETLGSFQVEVPAMASIEVRPEQQLKTFAPVNWKQLVVLYVDGGDGAALWQHLRRNIVTGALANASVCTYPEGSAAPPGGLVLNAALTHTFNAPFTPYASFISLHNAGDTAATYEARLHDAATGELKGRLDVTLAAHGSLSQSAHWFQSNAGWYFPRPDQTHMNIKFVRKTAGGEAADAGALVVGHTASDLLDGASVNLSNPCPVHTSAPGARN